MIEEAGGTSESAPFVSGAAALVMQAYKKTHGGFPSPAVVKRILLSTATDLGAPAQEQGSGLLNSLKAVQMAESYGHSAPHRVDAWPSRPPSSPTTACRARSKHYFVTLTNEGTKTQTVKAAGRALGADTVLGNGTVTLSDSASNQYAADTGSKVNYAVFKFHVPAGQGRLAVSIAYASNPNNTFLPVNLTLVDPNGKLAAESEPQGAGNFGNVDVRTPAAGLWTAIASGYPASVGGYNGKVVWHAVSEKFISFGNVQPGPFTLSPGQSKNIQFTLTTPANPGDMAGSLVVSSSLGGKTSIPVIVRTQVNVATGGKFTGTLTGGNGRGALGTGDYYAFNVPSGTKQVTVQLAHAQQPGHRQRHRRLPGRTGRQRGGLRAELRADRCRGRRHQPDAHRQRAQPGRRPVDAGHRVRRAGPGTEVSDAYAGHRRPSPSRRRPRCRPRRCRRGRRWPAGTPVTRPGDDHQHVQRAAGLLLRRADEHVSDPDAGADRCSARTRRSPRRSSKTTLPLSANADPVVLLRADAYLVGRGEADLHHPRDDGPDHRDRR